MNNFSRARQILSAVFFSLSLLACSEATTPLTSLTTPLPSLSVSPLSGIEDKISLAGAKEFAAQFARHRYQLDEVTSSGLAPPIFAINLPGDLADQPVPEKTSLFIRLLLPSVIEANRQIVAQREALQAIQKARQGGRALTSAQQQWLDALAALYRVEDANPEDLLQRVDLVPAALVLAQGIDESGWGSSRFAVQGNALYGQHAPAHGDGRFMAAAGGRVKVAAYDSVYQSTAAYLHNLNTTRAYRDLRVLRSQLRARGEPLSGHRLAGSLLTYSQRGERYVNDLRSIIRHHQLEALDDVKLADTLSPLLVEFSR